MEFDYFFSFFRFIFYSAGIRPMDHPNYNTSNQQKYLEGSWTPVETWGKNHNLKLEFKKTRM